MENKNNTEPFKPKHFFEAFNNGIPQYVNSKNKVRPIDIAKYRRDVEESDKIFFFGWIDHEKNKIENKNYKGNVQKGNLDKTRKYLVYS